MATKTLTPTQLYNAVQRLENVDITQLDFTKLPTGFDSAQAFEKSITKTLNSVRSQFSTAFKTYETAERNEKFNSVLQPWIERFDGNVDKALEALQYTMSNGKVPDLNAESTTENSHENSHENVVEEPSEHTTSATY